MSNKSVSYIYEKNQDVNYDDPFDLGSNVKDLTNMSHERRLSSFAEELVSHYGKFKGDYYDLSIDALSETDRNELAQLYIETCDRELTECIYGNDFSPDNKFTCALLAMLKNNTFENRQRFSEVTRENILIYYKESLQEVLDTACHDYFASLMDGRGMHAVVDNDHGDVVWRSR